MNDPFLWPLCYQPLQDVIAGPISMFHDVDQVGCLLLEDSEEQRLVGVLLFPATDIRIDLD